MPAIAWLLIAAVAWLVSLAVWGFSTHCDGLFLKLALLVIGGIGIVFALVATLTAILALSPNKRSQFQSSAGVGW